MRPSAGTSSGRAGTVRGYFSPAPVLTTTTSSPDASQPSRRSRATAAKHAAPSGQTQVPSDRAA